MDFYVVTLMQDNFKCEFRKLYRFIIQHKFAVQQNILAYILFH